VTDAISTQVSQIAAETFEVDVQDIHPQSSPQTLENWDSIQHLNFILALEAKFQIEFSAEEMESIRSIADAVKIVEQRTAHS